MCAAPARKLAAPAPAPAEGLGDLETEESIDGVTLMSPRPARRHASVAAQLLTALNYHFGSFGRRGRGHGRGGGGWVLLMEPELHLGGDKVAPDLAGWRPERAPAINSEAAFDTAPDWVCEVLSSRTRAWDRQKKMPLYAAQRVGHLWLVDPVLEELEVYALGRRGWELIASHSGAELIRAEPFESFALDLSLIWPERPLPPVAPAPAAPSKRGGRPSVRAKARPTAKAKPQAPPSPRRGR